MTKKIFLFKKIKNPWTPYEVVRRFSMFEFFLLWQPRGLAWSKAIDPPPPAGMRADLTADSVSQTHFTCLLMKRRANHSCLGLWACFSTPALPIKGLKLENSGYCSFQEYKMMTKLLFLLVKGHRSQHAAIVSLSYIWSDVTVLCMQFATQGFSTGNHTSSPGAGSFFHFSAPFNSLLACKWNTISRWPGQSSLEPQSIAKPANHMPPKSRFFKKIARPVLCSHCYFDGVLLFVLGAYGTMCQTSWNSVTQLKSITGGCQWCQNWKCAIFTTNLNPNEAACMSSSFLSLCDSLVQIRSGRTGVGIMRGWKRCLLLSIEVNKVGTQLTQSIPQ